MNGKQLMCEIDSLIGAGIDLTNASNWADVRKSKAVYEAYSDYIEWYTSCCVFLNQNGYVDETEIFSEGTPVKLMTWEFAYDSEKIKGRARHEIHHMSEEGLFALVADIRNQASAKLRVLRDVRARMQSIASKPWVFIYDMEGGVLCEQDYPGAVFLSFKSKRKKLVDVFVDHRIYGDQSYLATHDLTNKAGYTDSQRCRKSIHDIRERVTDAFPGFERFDFIEGEINLGYRITEKVSISIKSSDTR